MQLRRIDKKPCDCSVESFNYVKKEYRTIDGPYQVFHSYEIKECQNHKATWGRRRKEEKIIKCITPVNEYESKEIDLEFFKSVFASLWNDKINEKLWNKKLKAKYQDMNFDDLTNSFIQKGLILKKILVIQKSNKEKSYILLTDLGRKKIKDRIGFLSVEEQISMAKVKLLLTLKKENIKDYDDNKSILYNLLEDQLKRLESKNPGWKRLKKSFFIPRISAVNPPKYLIILYGLCTWFEIYRDNLTLREVSARAFQNSPILINEDPSKVLDKYSNDINSIIQKFSGKICDELGLILALDSFTFSGDLTLHMQDDNFIKIGGPSVSFSNLSYAKIEKINLNANLVIFIENYAVFAQMVLDNWAIKKKILLIYIKGMGISGHFRKKILMNILRNNPKVHYFIWVDYDLGGCNIYREIINNLEVDDVTIIKIPPELSIPYRTVPESQLKSIKEFCSSKNSELKNLATFILNNGRVEQEYLLEWYKEILRYNFRKYL